MIYRLALAELRHRPGRAIFLLTGYALGVAVMVVLLSVGEAMLEQARDRALVGGGELMVVPAGVSTEMLRTGGVASLFFGIDHARFLQRQLLESPRAREEYGIVAASPVLDGKQVELRVRGQRWSALAAGEIPSRARRAGAPAVLLSGSWEDSDADRAWVAPTQGELLREIDAFHLPPVRDSTWAEWHYFNVVLDEERWIYLTLIVAGEVGTPGRWGGRVLLTIREPNGEHRSLTRDLPGERVRFGTDSPDLQFGDSASVSLEGDGYRVRASAGGARVDLRVRPQPRRYFPRVDLGGRELVSGYVAPALYARAEGRVCLPACEEIRGAQAYHDHNWGVWRNVSWEWGSASDANLSLIYGAVRGDSSGAEGVFAALLDDRGARALFRPREISFPSRATRWVNGRSVSVPQRILLDDPRAGIRVIVEVNAAHITELERKDRRYFVQMRGVATVEERGRIVGRLPGFFETYVD